MATPNVPLLGILAYRIQKPKITNQVMELPVKRNSPKNLRRKQFGLITHLPESLTLNDGRLGQFLLKIELKGV